MIRYSDFLSPGTRFPSLLRLPRMIAIVGLGTILVACGNFELPGQPVARVNGKPITEQQLGNELLRAAGAAQSGAQRGKALQELVDRELLQAEAVRSRIDRDPHVAAALENARAEILAQAFLQSRVAYASAPSRGEIRAYFDKHPEKFSSRKLFHLNEIVLPSTGVTAELKAAVDGARSLDDVSAWLDGHRIHHRQVRRVDSSTDLPERLLTRMQGMQAGQMFITQEGNSASLLAITEIQDSPLSFEAAAPQIERLLLSRRGRELGESELARLRAGARVEYVDGGVASRLAGRQQSMPPPGQGLIVKASGQKQDAAQ